MQTQAFQPGTKAMTTGPHAEPCVIVRPRRVNLPMPGPDWRIVRFGDGGKVCIHVSRLSAISPLAAGLSPTVLP